MSRSDGPPPDRTEAGLDQLCHDLKVPLTVIAGRAQLLARTVRRSSALTEPERTTMLAGLATIEAAVRTMVPLIDGIGRDRPERREGGE